MKRIVLILSAWIFLAVYASAQLVPNTLDHAQQPYKGNAVLGNGNVCVVYSDDARITKLTNGTGIQHLYFQSYAADYVASTNFSVYDAKGNELKNASSLTGGDSIGFANFFTTLTKSVLPGGIQKEVRCAVTADDAVLLALDIKRSPDPLSYSFTITFRKNITTDAKNPLVSLTKEKNGVRARWADSTIIFVAPPDNQHTIEILDSTVVFRGTVETMQRRTVLIIPGIDDGFISGKLDFVKNDVNIFKSAEKTWNDWIQKGNIPFFKEDTPEMNAVIEAYKRLLYSAKSAELQGRIPADITGQFLTNGMPQLYPRDALMVARVFLLAGHDEEARRIISFWADEKLPMKSPGEFYARYDARNKATDGGSGARFDEPEWDSNGYLIQLVYKYYQKNNEWLASKTFLFSLADFLVNNIDSNGLLYEGGIVEWTGYLPSTNMICAAALKTASQIADLYGDTQRVAKYSAASELISKSLVKMFDPTRKAYTALRYYSIKGEGNVSYTDKTGELIYLWDGTANFGFLWGYPDHTELEMTNIFYEEHTTVLGGGLQYFEAHDNAGLTAYGSDAFIFPTAASVQYFAEKSYYAKAEKHLQWLLSNTNSYGLMPERIYLNRSDCSDASPLSWCNAETAAAILVYSLSIPR